MHAAIDIMRPPEAVYGFFLDMEKNIPATDPLVESVTKLTPGAIGPGTKYVIRQPVMGKLREQSMTITQTDPPHQIAMEAEFGPVRPRFSLTFDPIPDGTHVTLEGDSRPVGAMRLLPFLADRIGQRNWNRRLGLIKGVLERPEAERLVPK